MNPGRFAETGSTACAVRRVALRATTTDASRCVVLRMSGMLSDMLGSLDQRRTTNERLDTSRCGLFDLETADESLELRRHVRQLARGLLRVLRSSGDAGDVASDLAGTTRRFLDVPANLSRCRRLLLNRARDRAADVVHLTDNARDLANGADSALCVALNRFDLARDVFSRL